MTARGLADPAAGPGPVPWSLMRGARTRVSMIPVAAAIVGLAAVAWVASVQLMSGMDMGPETRIGSFGAFIALWIPMMTAMMLPGAAPAAARLARERGLFAAVRFAAAYVGVWALAGMLVYPLYRPHGTLAAGVTVVAAGLYELSPVKRHFRHMCGGYPRSGSRFGLYCAGSTAGLMAMLAALGIMSVIWMAVTGALAFAQKLLPSRAALDVPVALAIISLGCWISLSPASVPWLIPSM